MIELHRAELEHYSALWGSDPELVQGAGGNTSVKHDGRLLVKASGMRLADAGRHNVFVDVDLLDATAMAHGGPTPAVGDGMRPSIETSFHAVLPHRFVVHLHAVDVIAFAIRRDGLTALAPLLADQRWGWVPYRKPGAALAREVLALLGNGVPDVVVLGNHGLIVGAESCAEADALVRTVRARLHSPVRGGPADVPALERLAGRWNMEPARVPSAHLAATDPTSLAFAAAGTLYPDHAVFLGRGAAVPGNEGPRHRDPPLHLVPGIGALLPADASREAHEMAGCLGAVVARIPAGAPAAALTPEQEDELLDWDAERHRQELARSRPTTP